MTATEEDRNLVCDINECTCNPPPKGVSAIKALGKAHSKNCAKLVVKKHPGFLTFACGWYGTFYVCETYDKLDKIIDQFGTTHGVYEFINPELMCNLYIDIDYKIRDEKLFNETISQELITEAKNTVEGVKKKVKDFFDSKGIEIRTYVLEANYFTATLHLCKKQSYHVIFRLVKEGKEIGIKYDQIHDLLETIGLNSLPIDMSVYKDAPGRVLRTINSIKNKGKKAMDAIPFKINNQYTDATCLADDNMKLHTLVQYFNNLEEVVDLSELVELRRTQPPNIGTLPQSCNITRVTNKKSSEYKDNNQLNKKLIEQLLCDALSDVKIVRGSLYNFGSNSSGEIRVYFEGECQLKKKKHKSNHLYVYIKASGLYLYCTDESCCNTTYHYTNEAFKQVFEHIIRDSGKRKIIEYVKTQDDSLYGDIVLAADTYTIKSNKEPHKSEHQEIYHRLDLQTHRLIDNQNRIILDYTPQWEGSTQYKELHQKLFLVLQKEVIVPELTVKENLANYIKEKIVQAFDVKDQMILNSSVWVKPNASTMTKLMTSILKSRNKLRRSEGRLILVHKKTNLWREYDVKETRNVIYTELNDLYEELNCELLLGLVEKDAISVVDQWINIMHITCYASGFYNFYTGTIKDADIKLNENRSLIPFRNGVFDLASKTFRPNYREDDYISQTLNCDYNANVTGPSVFESFLNSTLESNEHKSIWYFLCGIFTDIALTKRLHVWTGKGSNGKTLFCNFIEEILAGFSYAPDVGFFTSGRGGNTGPKPEILKIKNKKLVVINEPEVTDRFLSGMLKMLTGNDTVTARELHSNHVISFKTTAVFLIIANQVPALTSYGYSEIRRLHHVHFNMTFVAHPDPVIQTQKKKDTDIYAKMISEAEKSKFMNLLITNYYEITQLIEDNVCLFNEENFEERIETECLLNQFLNRFVSVGNDEDVLSPHLILAMYSFWAKDKFFQLTRVPRLSHNSPEYRQNISALQEYLYERYGKYDGILTYAPKHMRNHKKSRNFEFEGGHNKVKITGWRGLRLDVQLIYDTIKTRVNPYNEMINILPTHDQSAQSRNNSFASGQVVEEITVQEEEEQNESERQNSDVQETQREENDN